MTECGLYREVVFIWRLLSSFYQGGITEVWPLFTEWSLPEVAFNTSLTVFKIFKRML